MVELVSFPNGEYGHDPSKMEEVYQKYLRVPSHSRIKTEYIAGKVYFFLTSLPIISSQYRFMGKRKHFELSREIGVGIMYGPFEELYLHGTERKTDFMKTSVMEGSAPSRLDTHFFPRARLGALGI